jgi:hypothetical protein
VGIRRSPSHTESVPDDAPWIEPVVIPDDLRELQPDIEAYHRELRHAARRRRLARLTGGRQISRLAVPLGVTAAALALATIVFTILTLGQPRIRHVPRQEPVATAPSAPEGATNGLLPDVTVRTSSGELSIRDLRPALVALVPTHCDCTELLSGLAGQAFEVPVPLVVVAPTAQDASVDALDGQIHRGHVIPVFDRSGALARAYDASGVTALVVAPDATVRFIGHDIKPDDHLELFLQGLAVPVASVSGNRVRG